MSESTKQKEVIAFRANDDEQKFIAEMSENLHIPKSRVVSVALKYFKKLLEEQRRGSPNEPLEDALLRLVNK